LTARAKIERLAAIFNDKVVTIEQKVDFCVNARIGVGSRA